MGAVKEYFKNKAKRMADLPTVSEAEQAFEAARQMANEADQRLQAANMQMFAARRTGGDADQDQARIAVASANVAVARARVAVHKAAGDLAKHRTQQAIESGDVDAIASDLALVARDVRRIFEEGSKAEREVLRIVASAWEEGTDVRKTLAEAAVLRSWAEEAGKLALARLEYAQGANARLRARFLKEGKPQPALFPQQPGFTVGPGDWYAEVVKVVVEGEDTTKLESLENNLRLMQEEEATLRANAQRAIEAQKQAAKDRIEELEHAKRTSHFQAEQRAVEFARVRAEADKRADEQRRLVDAHRARTGG
jgi:hypothetical protein